MQYSQLFVVGLSIIVNTPPNIYRVQCGYHIFIIKHNMDIQTYQQKYGNKWLRYWKHDKQLNEPNPDKGIYIKNSSTRRKIHWRDYDYYKDKVKQLTNNNKSQIPNIHKRGFNTYHIDHKISIKWGYDNGVLAEDIAHPSNCEMIWWKDNIRKSDQCKIDVSNKWIIDSLEQ